MSLEHGPDDLTTSLLHPTKQRVTVGIVIHIARGRGNRALVCVSGLFACAGHTEVEERPFAVLQGVSS